MCQYLRTFSLSSHFLIRLLTAVVGAKYRLFIIQYNNEAEQIEEKNNKTKLL